MPIIQVHVYSERLHGSVGLAGFISSCRTALEEHGETFSRSMHGGWLSFWHSVWPGP